MGEKTMVIDSFVEKYGADWVQKAIYNAFEVPPVIKDGVERCPKCDAKLSITGKPYCAWCGQHISRG